MAVGDGGASPHNRGYVALARQRAEDCIWTEAYATSVTEWGFTPYEAHCYADATVASAGGQLAIMRAELVDTFGPRLSRLADLIARFLARLRR